MKLDGFPQISAALSKTSTTTGDQPENSDQEFEFTLENTISGEGAPKQTTAEGPKYGLSGLANNMPQLELIDPENEQPVVENFGQNEPSDDSAGSSSEQILPSVTVPGQDFQQPLIEKAAIGNVVAFRDSPAATDNAGNLTGGVDDNEISSLTNTASRQNSHVDMQKQWQNPRDFIYNQKTATILPGQKLPNDTVISAPTDANVVAVPTDENAKLKQAKALPSLPDNQQVKALPGNPDNQQAKELTDNKQAKALTDNKQAKALPGLADNKQANGLSAMPVNQQANKNRSQAVQNVSAMKIENDVKIGGAKLEGVTPANFSQLIIQSIAPNARTEATAIILPTNEQPSTQLPKTLTVQLFPRSLGVVEVRISIANGTINIAVETSTVAAEKLLRAEIPMLAEKLLMTGITYDEMTVKNNPNLEQFRDDNTQERLNNLKSNSSDINNNGNNRERDSYRQLLEGDSHQSEYSYDTDSQNSATNRGAISREGIYL